MKNGLLELVMILDRSGSMQGLEADTIGGYNAMLEQQKGFEGEVLVSTVLFDHETTVLHDRVPLDKVSPLTGEDYTVRGSTALLDAVGGAVHHIAMVHKYAREEDRPAKTLFVIVTDGMENANRMYTYNRVKEMVERAQKEHGWEFLFLGANMDAIGAAAGIGIRAERAVRYENDGTGVETNFRSVSRAVRGMRGRCAESPAEGIPDDWKAEIEEDLRTRGGRRRK